MCELTEGWWFLTQDKQLLGQTESSFKFSNGWFNRFKKRYNIRLRRPTNVAQKQPCEKTEAIRKFHNEIRHAQHPSKDMEGPEEDSRIST